MFSADSRIRNTNEMNRFLKKQSFQPTKVNSVILLKFNDGEERTKKRKSDQLQGWSSH